MKSILPAILSALVAARTATAVATTMTLDEALIKDILPPASTKCKGAEADGEVSFDFTFKPLPPGHWYALYMHQCTHLVS